MTDSLLEITLPQQDNFLKIIETLTRIGLETKDGKLVQTCHILHKRGKYYICHFKELFELDGVQKSDFVEEDKQRRNAIARLLAQWNLCSLADPSQADPFNLAKVKIVSFKDKQKYILKSNYSIGKK